VNQDFSLDDVQVGRVLHFCASVKKCYAAMVVGVNDRPGSVNLKILPDSKEPSLVFRQEVQPNHISKLPETWHWPRECSSIR